MNLFDHGAQRLAGAALGSLTLLQDLVEASDLGRPGSRIFSNPELRDWLCAPDGLTGLLGALAPERASPVRAILFDKNPVSNWALGWHQDRTICVKSRVETSGFGPWTVKGGVTHVEPPFEIIQRMITARIHIDPADAENAPLLVAPGSHRLGRIPVELVDQVVDELGSAACCANAGDIWVYSTPILHASERSHSPVRRRVLQVDYSADILPDGLAWLGI